MSDIQEAYSNPEKICPRLKQSQYVTENNFYAEKMRRNTIKAIKISYDAMRVA